MSTQAGLRVCRFGARTLSIAALALASALWIGAGTAWAGSTLIYSFENGDQQGFLPNAAMLGVELSLDTIGATEGEGSLKVDLTQDETFGGPLSSLLPEALGDPPGVEYVLFDLTIVDPFGDPAGFADAGIIIFGVTQPDFPGGPLPVQAQYLASQASLGDLPAGTYPIRMNLDKDFTFGKSFNQLFGMPGSGPNDIIPTGFEIYINKSNTVPWTVYLDNIRVGEYDADFDASGGVDGVDFSQWKANFGTGDAADADGDGDSDGDDFLVWQRQFGGAGAGVAAAPEPSAAALAGVLLPVLLGQRRRRWHLVDAVAAVA